MMKNIYLIGKTLQHSVSAEIHKEIGLYDYALKEIPEDKLDSFILSKQYDGLNVTIPYKKNVYRLMDKLSDTARLTGAVNTVVNENGTLVGYNTDYFGFMYLLNVSGIEVYNKSVLILGTGGSAATVAKVVERQGAAIIKQLSHYDIDNGVTANAEIVVNCTPVGMYPDTLKSPVDLDNIQGVESVIDLVYNPRKTRLILQAEARQLKAVNGLAMLVAQAKRSAELFGGHDLDNEIIDSLTDKIDCQTRNIAFIGFGCSGKSAVANEIGKLTDKLVFDTDVITAEDMLCGNASEAIKQRGEMVFRAAERAVVKRLATKRGVIISTGGGTVLNAENAELIKQTSVTVYLNCPLEKCDFADRPLYPDLETAKKVFAERQTLYEGLADFTYINDHTKTAAQVAKEIYDEIVGD